MWGSKKNGKWKGDLAVSQKKVALRSRSSPSFEETEKEIRDGKSKLDTKKGSSLNGEGGCRLDGDRESLTRVRCIILQSIFNVLNRSKVPLGYDCRRPGGKISRLRPRLQDEIHN